jgi:hypothetical protein
VAREKDELQRRKINEKGGLWVSSFLAIHRLLRRKMNGNGGS